MSHILPSSAAGAARLSENFDVRQALQAEQCICTSRIRASVSSCGSETSLRRQEGQGEARVAAEQVALVVILDDAVELQIGVRLTRSRRPIRRCSKRPHGSRAALRASSGSRPEGCSPRGQCRGLDQALARWRERPVCGSPPTRARGRSGVAGATSSTPRVRTANTPSERLTGCDECREKSAPMDGAVGVPNSNARREPRRRYEPWCVAPGAVERAGTHGTDIMCSQRDRHPTIGFWLAPVAGSDSSVAAAASLRESALCPD